MVGQADQVRIHLHKKIGEGTFGDVVLCEKVEPAEGTAEEECHEYMAIKIIPKSTLLCWNMLQEGETEKRALEVKSPFLVDLHFAYASQSHLFLGMEYCPGGDLYQLLVTKGALDVTQATIYAAEIASALMTLHKQNIVYRDLKPENVVISSSGHIKLVDFGMSYIMDETELETGIVSESGTMMYSPPEFLLRLRHRTECDWWNLGILLYEMFTCETPFEADSEDNSIRNICSAEREPIIPENLRYTNTEMIILQLLQVEQNQRLGYNAQENEIKNHPFFGLIDWEKLEDRKYAVDFIPAITGPLDTSYFDQGILKSSLTKLVDDIQNQTIHTSQEQAQMHQTANPSAQQTNSINVAETNLNGYTPVSVNRLADGAFSFETISNPEPTG